MMIANHLKLLLCLMVTTATTFSIDNKKMPKFCSKHGSVSYINFVASIKNCGEGRSGTFAVIYQCETNDGKKFAMKILTIESESDKIKALKYMPSELEMYNTMLQKKLEEIISELDVMKQLYDLDEHQTFKSYATFQSDNSCFYDDNTIMVILDWLNGVLSDTIINDTNNIAPMSIPYRIYLTMYLTRGLVRLHDDNFLHFDIKPENIFMKCPLKPVLGDFALSKYYKEFTRSDDNQLIELPDVHGTIEYLAPEAFRRKYGKQIDVFALGVTLFNLWTGIIDYAVYKTNNTIDSWNNHYELIKTFCRDMEKKDEKEYPLSSDILCKAYGSVFSMMVDEVSRRPISTMLIDLMTEASINALQFYKEKTASLRFVSTNNKSLKLKDKTTEPSIEQFIKELINGYKFEYGEPEKQAARFVSDNMYLLIYDKGALEDLSNTRSIDQNVVSDSYIKFKSDYCTDKEKNQLAHFDFCKDLKSIDKDLITNKVSEESLNGAIKGHLLI